MITEIWRPIPGFQGYYEVSSLGKIRRTTNQRIRKLRHDRDGYLRVSARSDPKGKLKLMLVHRAVALAFIPNPKSKPEVNHKDSDKSNNCVDNLEWVTRTENSLHSIKNGHWPDNRGERCGSSRLTTEQVLEIRAKYRPWTYPQHKLASEYGVSRSAIMHALNDRWQHL